VPEVWIEERRKMGGEFYCPNGHCRVFRENELVRAKKELEQKQRELTASKCETLAEQQKRVAVEKEKDRLSKRIKNGVCPCCHRTVKQLSAHIANKHPEWQKEIKK
jgi:hypothetical protein